MDDDSPFSWDSWDIKLLVDANIKSSSSLRQLMSVRLWMQHGQESPWVSSKPHGGGLVNMGGGNGE